MKSKQKYLWINFMSQFIKYTDKFLKVLMNIFYMIFPVQLIININTQVFTATC